MTYVLSRTMNRPFAVGLRKGIIKVAIFPVRHNRGVITILLEDMCVSI